MALGEKEKKQLLGLAIFAAVAAAGAFVYYGHLPNTTKMSDMRVRIDSLSAQVGAARKELAGGSAEALRQRVEEYQGAVKVMRRLVPAAGEVPNLIDDVSSRAKRRGVSVAQFTPLGTEAGAMFETAKYRWSVIGHYDQVGEFLADVGSLPRIMVPYDVTLTPATQTAGRVFEDSTGSLLEVEFQLRAFVKKGAPGDSTQTGGTDQ